MNIKSKIAVIFFIVPLVSACATSRADLAAYSLPSDPDARPVILKKIDYDGHGLPAFNVVLSDRPSEPGERFAVAYYIDERPVKSYDIIVTDQKAELGRPLEIIYDWTGKGFSAGLYLTGHVNWNVRYEGSSWKELGALMVAVTAPTIIGGACGFVIGVVSSIPEAAAEIKNLFVSSKETLLSYTIYQYDARGRMMRMKMYAPSDPPTEVVRTDFFYRDDNIVPLKTEITSYPDNKVRTLE